MSRRCELTGKKPLVGHKVSHSNIKTKRRFLPNLRNVTLMSDALNRKVRVRVSANALKTVDHRGGLDAFLLKAKDAELAPKMLELKRQIAKKQSAARGGLSTLVPDAAQRESAAPQIRDRYKIRKFAKVPGLQRTTTCCAAPGTTRSYSSTSANCSSRLR